MRREGSNKNEKEKYTHSGSLNTIFEADVNHVKSNVEHHKAVVIISSITSQAVQSNKHRTA